MTNETQTEKKNHKLHPPALKVMHELHTSTVMWAALDGEPFKIVNRLLDYGLAQHRPDDRVVLTPDGITEALAAYAVRQRRHAENHADAMAALLKPPEATVIDGPQAGQLDDAALALLVPVYRAGLDLGAAGPQVQAYCDRMEQKHADTVAALPEWLQAPSKAEMVAGKSMGALASDMRAAADALITAAILP